METQSNFMTKRILWQSITTTKLMERRNERSKEFT